MGMKREYLDSKTIQIDEQKEWGTAREGGIKTIRKRKEI